MVIVVNKEIQCMTILLSPVRLYTRYYRISTHIKLCSPHLVSTFLSGKPIPLSSNVALHFGTFSDHYLLLARLAQPYKIFFQKNFYKQNLSRLCVLPALSSDLSQQEYQTNQKILLCFGYSIILIVQLHCLSLGLSSGM